MLKKKQNSIKCKKVKCGPVISAQNKSTFEQYALSYKWWASLWDGKLLVDESIHTAIELSILSEVSREQESTQNEL